MSFGYAYNPIMLSPTFLCLPCRAPFARGSPSVPITAKSCDVAASSALRCSRGIACIPRWCRSKAHPVRPIRARWLLFSHQKSRSGAPLPGIEQRGKKSATAKPQVDSKNVVHPTCLGWWLGGLEPRRLFLRAFGSPSHDPPRMTSFFPAWFSLSRRFDLADPYARLGALDVGGLQPSTRRAVYRAAHHHHHFSACRERYRTGWFCLLLFTLLVFGTGFSLWINSILMALSGW